ncbi:MAG: lipopolysaccharide biosynthesis protein [Bryobacteraceae bacterium]
MSRSRRFLGGLAMTYGYQAMVLFVGLWLTPFYLRRIGQHDYGLWLVGTQLLTYLSLTDFGVVELLPQEVAYSTGRAGGVEKAQDLSRVVGQTVRLVLYQLPVVIAIAIAMFFAIPAEWQALRGPLTFILLGFVAAFPLRMLPALLQGLQDLTFAGGVQILNWVLSTAATVWMVWSGWSLFALAAGWLISQLLLVPLIFYRIWTRFPQVLPRRLPPFDLIKTKIQLGKGMWICLSQVATLLMAQTDLLIIGRLLGPAAVVPYACTCKLISVLANQAQILMQTATPGLCEVKSGESRERMFQVLVSLTHGMLFLSGLIVCVVLPINHWFVDWWVTARQYGGLALTLAFIANVAVRHWTTTTAFTVFCFGHQRRISLTNLFDGLVSAGSCLVLTMLFGLPGAALGSVVGAAAISLPFNLRVIARDTGVTVRRLILAMLGSWIWRFAVIMTALVWIAMRWSPRNLGEAAATAAATAAAYGLLMLPNIFKSPLGGYIRPILASFRLRYAAFQMRLS